MKQPFPSMPETSSVSSPATPEAMPTFVERKRAPIPPQQGLLLQKYGPNPWLRPAISVRVQRIAAYTTAVVLCLLALDVFFKLHRANLRVPFTYGAGDAWLIQMWTKSVIDHGWYLYNPSVGAPFGLEMHDFPMADNLHFLGLKILGMITHDFGMAFNLYFLLGFPLSTLTALFVLRHFHVSFMPALAGSLLFTFLPFRFIRSQHHLFLTAYYLVPLMVMVVLWLYQDRLFWMPCANDSSKRRLDLFSKRSIAAIVISLLVASGGVYFAFFGCFFLLIAGIDCSVSRRRLYPLGAAAAVILFIAGGVVANISPSLIYHYQNGRNEQVAQRQPREAELYGLKITQLLLPTTRHRVPYLSAMKERYNAAPLVTENDWSTLGVVGSVGFLFLLGRLFVRNPRAVPRSLPDGLCMLNLFGVLFTTIGGFGALFAFLATPSIRAYNRISVYLAFFAFLAVAMLLDQLVRRFPRTSAAGLLMQAFCAVVLWIGLYDQSSNHFYPHHNHLQKEYDKDVSFVRQIEAAVPAQAMIYQIPYVPFPELGGYDHFRGFFHSQSLRWSYGCMRGRPGDRWHQTVAALPIPEMLETLAGAGFEGIYISRNAVPNRAQHVEAELSAWLQVDPIISDDQNLSFFSMREYKKQLGEKLAARIDPAEIAAR